MPNQFDPYYKWLGIPPKDQPPNHYRLLGIDLFEPDREVIDAAANRLMAYLHDLASGEHAEASQRLLNEIAAARLCLLSPEEKAGYDAALKLLGHGSTAAPPPVPSAAPVTPPPAPITPPPVPRTAPSAMPAFPDVLFDAARGTVAPAGSPQDAAGPQSPFPAIEPQPRGSGRTRTRASGDSRSTSRPHTQSKPPHPATRRSARRKQNQLAMMLLLSAAIILALLIALLAWSS